MRGPWPLTHFRRPPGLSSSASRLEQVVWRVSATFKEDIAGLRGVGFTANPCARALAGDNAGRGAPCAEYNSRLACWPAGPHRTSISRTPNKPPPGFHSRRQRGRRRGRDVSTSGAPRCAPGSHSRKRPRGLARPPAGKVPRPWNDSEENDGSAEDHALEVRPFPENPTLERLVSSAP